MDYAENTGYKIVDFEPFCKTCEYQKRPEFEKPCNECLENPVNFESKRPLKWSKKCKK